LVILSISHGTVSVLIARKKSAEIWRPLGFRTLPVGATLSAMEWFHLPTTIVTDLLIIIIVVINIIM
jgi:hypothetical protein